MTRSRIKLRRGSREDLGEKLPNKVVKPEQLSDTQMQQETSEENELETITQELKGKMRKDGRGRKMTGFKSQGSHWSSHPELKPLWDYLYNKKYSCSVCNLAFENAPKYFNHVRSHKSHQTCKICDVLIPKGAEEMAKHSESAHPNGFLYQCLGCDRKFKSKLGLKNHYIGTHAPRNARYICKICQTTYGDKVQLERHIKTHEYEHPCFICLKKIKTLEELKSHMKAAHCLYFCTTCSAYFVDPVVLKEHEQKHNDSTSCHGVLDSYTTSLNDSTSATIVGNRESEVPENVSDVAINNEEILQKSVDMIEKQDNSLDNAVESIINQNNSLGYQTSESQSEIPSVNENESKNNVLSDAEIKNPDDPEESSETMASDTEKKDMNDKTTEEDLKAAVIGSIKGNRDKKTCKFCGRQYKHGVAFLNHLKLHNNKSNFTCEHCGKVCKTDETYKRHIILHLPDEEKPFHCDVCQKGFQTRTNLNKHLIVHNEPNALLCEICGKGHKDPRMLKVLIL